MATMLTKQPQAISGVSPGAEVIVEDTYPSVGATAIGRWLDGIWESLPLRLNGVPLSYLLFVLPSAPLTLLAYFWLKVFGTRYVITNRAVKVVSSLGYRLHESVALEQIAQVVVDQSTYVHLLRSADVRLVGADGDTLLVLRGVSWPERFCQVVRETRDARKHTANALARINARH